MLKEFMAVYEVKNTGQRFEQSVFAMSKSQAFDMYQLSFARLVDLVDVALLDNGDITSS